MLGHRSGSSSAPSVLCPLALLGLLVIFALALRLPGAALGLPHPYLPDEEMKVGAASTLAARQYSPPGVQPGFLPYSLHAVLTAAEPLRPLMRQLAENLSSDTLATQTAFMILVGRLWMGLLSALTLVPVFLATRRLANLPAAFAAAFLLALNPVAIAAAGYIKEDTPLTFWIAWTAFFAIRRLQTRQLRDAAISAIAAGLAVGSKYSGCFAILIAVMPEFALQRRGLAPRLAFVGSIALAAFVASNPSILWNAAPFLHGAAYQLSYALAGHHDGISLPLTTTFGLFYAHRVLVPTFGFLGLAGVALGVTELRQRQSGEIAILATWSIGYIALMESFPAKPYPFFARYILPGITGLVILQGLGLSCLARWIRGSRQPVIRAVCLGCIAMLLALPLATAATLLSTMYPDTRDLAADWLERHRPDNRAVFVSTYAPPLRDRGYFELALPLLTDATARPHRDLLLVVSSLALDRHLQNPEQATPEIVSLLQSLEGASVVRMFAKQPPQFGFFNPAITVLCLAAHPGSASANERPDAQRGLCGLKMTRPYHSPDRHP